MDDKMALIPIEQQQLVSRVSQQIALTDRLLSLHNDDLPELIPYRKGDKWGFCDFRKRIVIDCIYEDVSRFNEGKAAIEKNQKWGFIDKNGIEIITCIYETFSWSLVLDEIPIFPMFSEGLLGAFRNQKWGFIDVNGIEIIPCELEVDCSFSQFSEGLAKISDGKYPGKWGFIDKNGQIVLPCYYQSVSNFTGGLVIVCKNLNKYKEVDKFGFLDKNFNQVIPPKGSNQASFSYAPTPFRDGISLIKDGVLHYYFLDNKGNYLIDAHYYKAFPFSEGLAPIKQSSNEWKFINKDGEIVVDGIYKYELLNGFSEGLAPITHYYKSGIGFIDKSGIVVIPININYTPSPNCFVEGFAKVQREGKWGFIDKKGVEIIECCYQEVENFYQGLALVEKNEKKGYINKRGVEYWEN